ncbi:hypothetical protein C1X05_13730 [Laceyella sacchari]|nr:hypothetical protein C1X05_13730 [Laceyella sacchari]
MIGNAKKEKQRAVAISRHTLSKLYHLLQHASDLFLRWCGNTGQEKHPWHTGSRSDALQQLKSILLAPGGNERHMNRQSRINHRTMAGGG